MSRGTSIAKRGCVKRGDGGDERSVNSIWRSDGVWRVCGGDTRRDCDYGESLIAMREHGVFVAKQRWPNADAL